LESLPGCPVCLVGKEKMISIEFLLSPKPEITGLYLAIWLSYPVVLGCASE